MDLKDAPAAVRALQRRSVSEETKRLCAQHEGRLRGGDLPAGDKLAAAFAFASRGEWEASAVGLLLIGEVFDAIAAAAAADAPAGGVGPEAVAGTGDGSVERVVRLCVENLCHPEPRVRTLVAVALGKAARAHGPWVYGLVRGELMGTIEEQFDRGSEVAFANLGGMQFAVDDTTGWRALETAMLTLNELLKGCGERALEALDEDLARMPGMLRRAVSHRNRHVRQAAFQIQATLCLSCRPLPDDLVACVTSTLADGLQDNWSQVRYESSVCCRHLLSSVGPARAALLPVLLPRMCLNRYYLAEGVRNYSQQTWRIAFGTSGAELVEAHLSEMCEYYSAQAAADNHAVREAACAAICELAQKLPPAALRPHLDALVGALLLCFRDESWPVRDAACLATGAFVKVFAGDCGPLLDQLLPKWLHNLADPIASVREGAAVALGDVCEGFKTQPLAMATEKIEVELSRRLRLAWDQAPETEEQAAERQRLAAVDGQQYSCGSLAPKLRRNTGGCSDCAPQRDAELWEHTDGALYLVRELSRTAPQRAARHLPAVAEILDLRHFPDVVRLRETAYRVLPAVKENLGRTFHKYAEDFRTQIEEDTMAAHQLLRAAAQDAHAALYGAGARRGKP